MIKHSFTQHIRIEDLPYANGGRAGGWDKAASVGHGWDTQFCGGDNHPLNNYENDANNVCKLMITSFRKCRKVHDAARVCHGGFLRSAAHHKRLPRGGDIWTAPQGMGGSSTAEWT